jgi:ribosomal protein L21
VYAIIEDSGTQIKVAPGDVVDIDLRAVGPRTKKIKFDRVLLLGGDANGDATIGAPSSARSRARRST